MTSCSSHCLCYCFLRYSNYWGGQQSVNNRTRFLEKKIDELILLQCAEGSTGDCTCTRHLHLRGAGNTKLGRTGVLLATQKCLSSWVGRQPRQHHFSSPLCLCLSVCFSHTQTKAECARTSLQSHLWGGRGKTVATDLRPSVLNGKSFSKTQKYMCAYVLNIYSWSKTP